MASLNYLVILMIQWLSGMVNLTGVTSRSLVRSRTRLLFVGSVQLMQSGLEQGEPLVHFCVDCGGDSITLPSSATENWLAELVDMILGFSVCSLKC